MRAASVSGSQRRCNKDLSCHSFVCASLSNSTHRCEFLRRCSGKELLKRGDGAPQTLIEHGCFNGFGVGYLEGFEFVDVLSEVLVDFRLKPLPCFRNDARQHSSGSAPFSVAYVRRSFSASSAFCLGPLTNCFKLVRQSSRSRSALSARSSADLRRSFWSLYCRR